MEKAKSKGQVATEFLLYSGVFLFVVIAAFSVVSVIQKTEVGRHESQLSKEVGGTFADGLKLAAEGGEGFNYSMTFPKYLIGTPYTIDFSRSQEGLLIMEWDGSYSTISHAYTVPLADYEFYECFQKDGQRVTLVSDDSCENDLSMYNNGDTVRITRRE